MLCIKALLARLIYPVSELKECPLDKSGQLGSVEIEWHRKTSLKIAPATRANKNGAEISDNIISNQKCQIYQDFQS